MQIVKRVWCGPSNTLCTVDSGEVFSWGNSDGGRLGRKIDAKKPSNISCGPPALIPSLGGTGRQPVCAALMGDESLLLLKPARY